MTHPSDICIGSVRGVADGYSRTYVRCVDRRYELENMRRSIVMLPSGTAGLSREEAIAELAELADVQARLERLRDGLRRLVDEDAST